jgi:hypothetical protein
MSDRRHFRLKTYDFPGVAYLELLDHPVELVAGIVTRTVDVAYLIDNYVGPRIKINFDKENRPIGIGINKRG